MKYHFKIHKEQKGFSAQCIELEGCVTEADTLEELKDNMKEALELYIEEPSDSKDLAALPDETIKKTKNIIAIPLDPQIALGFLVRYYRIKLGISQQEAAQKMGFSNLYSYQRLEASKCNPSLKILSKIKQIFPNFSVDYALNVK